MTKINLLPWREEARELERKAFLGKLLASALIAFCAGLFMGLIGPESIG